MSSRFMISSSRISTHRRCDNCGITIDFVTWKQCTYCMLFDLCPPCSKFRYDELPTDSRNHHAMKHKELSITGEITDDFLKWILVADAEKFGYEARKIIKHSNYERIQQQKKIYNDYDLYFVMERLKKLTNESSTVAQELELKEINSLIVEYHLQSFQRNINVLSLDGGGKIRRKICSVTFILMFSFTLILGVRGYMPIKILTQFISEKFLSNLEKFDPNNAQHRELFKAVQSRFAEQFDYLIGTSTGGLIAFCLAINYNILDMKEIYERYSYYFKRNYLGPLIYSKYNPSRIHNKIDEIINGIKLKDGTKLSAESATLLDIRNLLNPDNVIDDEKSEAAAPYHSNFLEFTDENISMIDSDYLQQNYSFCRVKREKILLITSYNTTTDSITVFNTSFAKHWGYRIADVLKATMAAPTYFPPQEVWSGKKHHGHFMKQESPELYIDGGVFANDPELAALAVIRMQWKKRVNYHLLSIGTGCYNTKLSSSTWGGYLGWIFNNGFLINTLMDATRSFIETISSNLAKFRDIRRMKLNYQITKSIDLDDGSFITVFDDEWEHLKGEEDYKAFIYFYDTFIAKQN